MQGIFVSEEIPEHTHAREVDSDSSLKKHGRTERKFREETESFGDAHTATSFLFDLLFR